MTYACSGLIKRAASQVVLGIRSLTPEPVGSGPLLLDPAPVQELSPPDPTLGPDPTCIIDSWSMKSIFNYVREKLLTFLNYTHVIPFDNFLLKNMFPGKLNNFAGIYIITCWYILFSRNQSHPA